MESSNNIFHNLDVFNRQSLEYIPLQYIYIDENREITNIKEDKFLFTDTNNTIKSNELVYLIRKNMMCNGEKYRSLSILKYNLIHEPAEVILPNSDLQTELISLSSINSIVLENTISIFHDLNTIYLIYYKHDKKKHTRNSDSTRKRDIKKIFINNKTTRKR